MDEFKRSKLFNRNFIQLSSELNENEQFYLYFPLNPTNSMLNINELKNLCLLKELQQNLHAPVVIHILDNYLFLSKTFSVGNLPDSEFVKTIVISHFSDKVPMRLKGKATPAFIKGIKEIEFFQSNEFQLKFLTLICESIMKQVVSVGFDLERTFLFRTLQYVGQNRYYYENILRCGSVSTDREVEQFYSTWRDNVETLSLASKDIAAMLSLSFPIAFGNKSFVRCLVLCAEDDFDEKKMKFVRYVAHKVGYLKPLFIRVANMPGLPGKKPMRSDEVNSAVFLNDSPKTIEKKVRKFAFSGGRDTEEDHRKFGGNCSVDVSFQYLRHLLDDNNELCQIEADYSSGRMRTGDLKQRTINVINEFIQRYQNEEAVISEELVRQFTTPHPLQLDDGRQESTVVNEGPEELDELDKQEEEKAVLKPTGDIVTPWEVVGESDTGIDYDKLIENYGSSKIEPNLIEKFEQVTGRKAHHFLSRGIFYSHREFNEILDKVEKKEPFFIYTGRGPSSDALHLGHMIPFIFTKKLQETFGVPVIIQLTDDEKAIYRGISFDAVTRMAIENTKDIIAVGFDPANTFIFRDMDYIGREPAFFQTAMSIGAKVSLSQMRAIFGFGRDDAIEKIAFPPKQAATSFSCAFPTVFGGERALRSLIPCAIDQDPYFRMTRDVAPRLDLPKPSLILSRFFPALQGNRTKMNASDPNSAIFMTDSPDQIAEKVMVHAFALTDEQRRSMSADDICQTETCFLYLSFFMEDNNRLEEIRQRLVGGSLSTDELKKLLIDVLVPIVTDHQKRRALITKEDLEQFSTPFRRF